MLKESWKKLRGIHNKFVRKKMTPLQKETKENKKIKKTGPQNA